jgi:hypothetical protein
METMIQIARDLRVCNGKKGKQQTNLISKVNVVRSEWVEITQIKRLHSKNLISVKWKQGESLPSTGTKVYWIINGRLLLEGKAVYTVTTGMVIQYHGLRFLNRTVCMVAGGVYTVTMGGCYSIAFRLSSQVVLCWVNQ